MVRKSVSPHLDTDLGLEIPFPPRLGIVEEYSEEDFTPTGDVKCHKKGGEGIPHPRRGFLIYGGFPIYGGVSRRVGKGFPTHGGDFSRPQVMFSVARRVGKGFPTHGGDFSRLRGIFHLRGCVKKGGEGDSPPTAGISHLRGISYLRGCVKKGGERIPHPRRGFHAHR